MVLKTDHIGSLGAELLRNVRGGVGRRFTFSSGFRHFPCSIKIHADCRALISLTNRGHGLLPPFGRRLKKNPAGFSCFICWLGSRHRPPSTENDEDPKMTPHRVSIQQKSSRNQLSAAR
jgi:hypothetical protein